MKKIQIFLSLMVMYLPISAQYETVVFNYERSQFNDGQPLPAEENLTLTGQVNKNVQMVEVLFLRPGLLQGSSLYYSGQWVREYSNTSERFIVPVNYKLRQNSEYDIRINYYHDITLKQRQQLTLDLNKHLLNYLDQIILIKKGQVRLKYSYRTVKSNLDQIVIVGLANSRNRINEQFRGFSDIVKEELKNIDGISLRMANRLIHDDSLLTKRKNNQKKYIYAQDIINKLKNHVINEVNQYLSMDLLMIAESKYMPNYPTEKRKSTLSINLGYGGVYLNSNDSQEFGNGLYAGVAFPLSRKSTSSEFLRNLSFNAGMFLRDFEVDEIEVQTGPIFGRPTYLGFGYKVFHVVRLNAGAVFLQNKTTGSQLLEINNVSVRPFVGISAELKLWLGTE